MILKTNSIGTDRKKPDVVLKLGMETQTSRGTCSIVETKKTKNSVYQDLNSVMKMPDNSWKVPMTVKPTRWSLKITSLL